jgi:N-acetylneuraminic acid mutarotase
MSWNKVTYKTQENVPQARSSHTVTTCNNKVYVFGGENIPRVPIGSDLHVFDPKTNSWEVIEATGDIPTPRLAHTTVAIGNKLYVFGGRDANHNDLDELFEFNTITKSWRKIVADKTPLARSYHAATVLGTKMYIFAGCGNKSRYNDLYSYDVETNSWTQCSNAESAHAPEVRGGPALCALKHNSKDYLFLFGGFKGEQLGDMHAFDVESGKWISLPYPTHIRGDLPQPRSVHCMCPLSDDNLFLFGGEKEASLQGHLGGGKYYDNTFIFDTKNYAWKEVIPTGEKPSARAWLVGSSFIDPDTSKTKVCVFGGFDGVDRLNDMYVFEL